MTQTTVAVPVGSYIQAQALANGSTTIINNDSTQSVWLSNNPNGSGDGVQLNALASTTWQAQGQPIYMAGDVSNTGPVSVTLTDSIINLQDPVAVGAAIAVQLISTGVRIVASSQVLFNQTVPANSSSAVINISQYSSLIMTGNAPPIAYTPGPRAAIAKQYGNNEYLCSTLISLFNPTFLSTSTPAIVAVVGDSLIISNSTSSDIQVSVIGSTRDVAAIQSNGSNSAPDEWQNTVSTMVAGTEYPLTRTDMGVNGQVGGAAYADLSIGGTVVQGTFLVHFIDGYGQQQTYNLAQTASFITQGSNQFKTTLVAMPKIQYVISFLCLVGGSGYAVARFTPNGG